MTSEQVAKTSVTIKNNSPIQDYVHLDDNTQPTYVIPFLSNFSAHKWTVKYQ